MFKNGGKPTLRKSLQCTHLSSVKVPHDERIVRAAVGILEALLEARTVPGQRVLAQA